jgi:hypothetical protein
LPELISIAITAHDRKKQLLHTLWSIEHSKDDYPVEVIVIDDDSQETLSDNELAKYSFKLNYQVRNDRKRQDPVIPNNMAFALCNGDIILMTCGEVAYMGHVISHCFRYLDETKYICYSTYSIGMDLYEKVSALDWSEKKVIKKVKEIISPMAEYPEYQSDCNTGWYAHPVYKPLALSFCAAMTRKNLEALSGYDERFQNGTGYADNDLLRRIIELGLNVEWITDPFCIHQPHAPTDYTNMDLVNLNYALFDDLAKKKTIKADQNVIYKR